MKRSKKGIDVVCHMLGELWVRPNIRRHRVPGPVFELIAIETPEHTKRYFEWLENLVRSGIVYS